MKLKNKILLAAAGLLVVSGAAATTGTFAWFTAASTATTKATTMTAMSDTTALNLECTTSDPALISTNNTSTDGAKHDFVVSHQGNTSINTGNVAHKLTDISGNGTKFYKATTQGVMNSEGSITGVNITGANEVSSRVAPYLFQFKLVFTSTNYTSTNGGNALAIFLDPTLSHIYDAGGTSSSATNISGAIRVGFSDSADGSGNEVGYYAPNDDVNSTAEGSTDYTYFSGTTATSVTSCDGLTNVMDKDFATTKYTEASTVTTSSNGYLGVANATALTLYMNVWLEGQDAECSNDYDTTSFDLSIHFYGLNKTVKAA